MVFACGVTGRFDSEHSGRSYSTSIFAPVSVTM
jgi:hypothetical protein